jgi:hypothetical protein
MKWHVTSDTAGRFQSEQATIRYGAAQLMASKLDFHFNRTDADELLSYTVKRQRFTVNRKRRLRHSVGACVFCTWLLDFLTQTAKNGW